jgi:hypothetical protein
MRIRTGHLAIMLAGAILLAGCASPATTSGQARQAHAAGNSMAPGMIMPDGSTMGAAATTPAAGDSAGQPSKSALMICQDETRASLKTVLALAATPVGTSTYADHLYTCTYRLPMGTLTLSVKELPNKAATDAYYTALKQRLSRTHELAGLGQAAYGTDTGTVVLRKDNDVLHVDASSLPAVFGHQHTKRGDFAYEIASDILGCWTGD